MTNDLDAAKILYPDMEQQPTSRPAATSEKAGADKLYTGPGKYESPFENDTKEKDPETDKQTTESKVEGAPEEYGEFTLPEGFEADAETQEAFEPVARELNLSKEQAQKLVDFEAERQERAVEAYREQLDDWRNRSLEEFSEDDLSVAKKLVQTYGDADLKELIDNGLGNHPAFIRFVTKAAKR